MPCIKLRAQVLRVLPEPDPALPIIPLLLQMMWRRCQQAARRSWASAASTCQVRCAALR